MKKIVLLGATGSIGASCFELVGKNLDKFQIVGASAHSRFPELERQAGEFGITHLLDTRQPLLGPPLRGEEKFTEFLKKCEPDIVLNAVVGFAGLKFSMQTLEQKIPLALANKESLVAGGGLLMDLSARMKTPIIPVDSEHSAIFECLVQNTTDSSSPGQGRLGGVEKCGVPTYEKFQKILLTCSGGPFFGKTREELKAVTKAQALKHPNWEMGAGITIDSATLANKCLEFFEAMHLFGATKDQIEIVIHRESIVHSMVEFEDSSILAQLAPPNMELPMGLALNYPDRADYKLPRQDFRNLDLSFREPDKTVFTTLKLLDICADNMQNFPIVFNAAKEVLVQHFLAEKIGFIDIFNGLERVINDTKLTSVDSFDQIIGIDAVARKQTQLIIDKCKKDGGL